MRNSPEDRLCEEELRVFSKQSSNCAILEAHQRTAALTNSQRQARKDRDQQEERGTRHSI